MREGSALESRVSLSGYAPDDGDDTAPHAPAQQQQHDSNMLSRLTRFYAHYHPANLPRVAAVAQQYAGKETLLFALLVKKYGPEPPSATPHASHEQAHRNDAPAMRALLSSEAASVMHYSGRRVRFPTVVTPQQGNTDCETPYWAGGATLISERDLLALLRHGASDNSELQKCYMGTLTQHPQSAWNGMVYLHTRAAERNDDDIAPRDTRFLGHVWVATLSSSKTLVYHGRQYVRTTLYCTDECQCGSGGSGDDEHERWRLSVYRDTSDTRACTLLRVMWDPVVVPEPVPLTRSMGPLPHGGSGSSEPLSASMLSSSSSSHGGSVLSRSAEPQPLQPSLASTVAALATRVAQLEQRVCERLDHLDARLAGLEHASSLQ